MLVNVNQITVRPGSTIALSFGVDAATGKAVVFGGDHRAMSVIQEALAAGDGVIRAEVDPWQLL